MVTSMSLLLIAVLLAAMPHIEMRFSKASMPLKMKCFLVKQNLAFYVTDLCCQHKLSGQVQCAAEMQCR